MVTPKHNLSTWAEVDAVTAGADEDSQHEPQIHKYKTNTHTSHKYKKNYDIHPTARIYLI